jgi:hypothetical protein
MMTTTKVAEVEVAEVPRRNRLKFALATRAGLYSLLVLAVALGAGAYNLRVYGVFSCRASGYGQDSYLGYCGATGYGDYDHGAIWFGLEPAAVNAARNAEVLFLGSSRTVFGFSSRATDEWFSSHSETYYLLGFTYYENYTFEGPLLQRIRPQAKVYVINIDSFFQNAETEPGKAVMREESAKLRYQEKRRWQSIHKVFCGNFNYLCGDNEAIFRSRATGSWIVTGTSRFKSQRASYNNAVDAKKLAEYTTDGRRYLAGLATEPACTILTILPTVDTDLATARALASALGRPFVEPRLEGLVTFDGSHLNRDSAQRWSTAFFEQAGPQIQKCLHE